tara:strand:- start:271 stop:456 length:186 start_codon:yes stop_codon:yes gene_type:complete
MEKILKLKAIVQDCLDADMKTEREAYWESDRELGNIQGHMEACRWVLGRIDALMKEEETND